MRPARAVPILILLLGPPGAADPAAAPGDAPRGYTFHRVVIWAEPGHPPPRISQDPETRDFVLLLPGPIPDSGWDPVEARRYIARRGGFLPAPPLPILRPRDPDPDWAGGSPEASFDVNRDGKAELLRAREVLVPDPRDPHATAHRVLVEIREAQRPLFGDLLEGPRSGPVELHGVATLDFTGEGYDDFLVRLLAEGRSGIALYSQAAIRFPGVATREVRGFSSEAFGCDRYAVFDLGRKAPDFFARLPGSARTAEPACQTQRSAGAAAGRGRCRYVFPAPYLGWVRNFDVEFVPRGRIHAFDLWFPDGPSAQTPLQALDLLSPVLGGGYRVEEDRTGGSIARRWVWEGKGCRAVLAGERTEGGERAVSLRIERD
jgi:hypothetical protein